MQKFINMYEVIGKKLLNIVAKTLDISPVAQSIVNMGAVKMFAIGDINGSWLNIATDIGREHILDEIVNAKALLIKDGILGTKTPITYSNNLANRIIPIVELADNTKDTDTEVWGFILSNTNMHIPIAFNGAGLFFPKKEYMAIYVISAALKADIGIAAHIK